VDGGCTLQFDIADAHNDEPQSCCSRESLTGLNDERVVVLTTGRLDETCDGNVT
jgi:hypothetical protein